MYDLVVVGGGYWGVSCYLHAKEQGLNVLLIDNGDLLAGSRNSLGTVRLSWYKGSTVSKLFPEGWDYNAVLYGVKWARKYLKLRQTGEMFSSYQNHDWKFREDFFLIDELDPLNIGGVRHLYSSVQQVRKRKKSWLLRVSNDRVQIDIDTKNVILATGCFPIYKMMAKFNLISYPDMIMEHDPMLYPAMLFGSNLHIRIKGSYPVPLTFMYRPYNHVTIRKWDDHYIFGSSMYKPHQPPRLNELKALCRDLIGDYDLISVTTGIRPITPKFVLHKLRDGLIYTTGGGRVGIALAGFVGKKAIEALL